jgi:hypothetical protein
MGCCWVVFGSTRPGAPPNESAGTRAPAQCFGKAKQLFQAHKPPNRMLALHRAPQQHIFHRQNVLVRNCNVSDHLHVRPGCTLSAGPPTIQIGACQPKSRKKPETAQVGLVPGPGKHIDTPKHLKHTPRTPKLPHMSAFGTFVKLA